MASTARPRAAIIIGSICAALCAVTGLLVVRAAADVGPLSARPPIVIPRTVGYFDYMIVDGQLRRVVVAHTQSQSVAFVDVDTGVLEKQVYVGAAPHGIALDQQDGTYYVGTSGAEHGVVAIDRRTLKVVRIIRTPGPVDAVAFDSRRGLLYADEDDGNSIWLIAARSSRIIATLNTPLDSDKVEYDPLTDRVYQNFTTTNSMLVLSPGTHVVLASWSTLPAISPHGLAIDSVHRRVFVAGVNGKLAVLDIATGRVIGSVDIAPHVDQIAMDISGHRIYCASGQGLLSVVDVGGKAARLLAEVRVPRGAHTVAVDQATGSVWIAYGTERDDYVMRLEPR